MKMQSVLVLAALALASVQNAHADAAGPAWGCKISAKLAGFERGFIAVVKVLEGNGTMKCAAVNGDYIKEFPIKMTVEGAGLGLGWSEIKNQDFLTGTLGVSEPGFLYGEYQGQINADATVINVNGTAGIGLEFSKGGLGVKGVLSGGDANGAFAGITAVAVKIEPLTK